MSPFTYRTAEMSLQDLKRVASTPYQLSTAFIGKCSAKTEARTFKVDTGGLGPPPQYALNLLPGGRWLVHADRGAHPAGGGPGRVSLSDVGEIHEGKTQPFISFPLLAPSDSWPSVNAVQSDPINRRFIIAVSYLSGFPLCVSQSVSLVLHPLNLSTARYCQTICGNALLYLA